MGIKRTLAIIFISLALCMTHAYASFSFKLGIGLEFINASAITGEADVNLLGVLVMPQFKADAFSMKLRAPIYFSMVPQFPFLDPWFNNWLPPKRLPEESDFSHTMRTISRYASVIEHIEYGVPYDDFYFRWGKLGGYTMGDGALLQSYKDTSVALSALKPGLVVKLDARAFNFPWFGFEFVTDDIFFPAMIAGRIFARPLTSLQTPIIKNLQVGVSVATDPKGHEIYSDDGTTVIPDEQVVPLTAIAIDARLPLVENKWFGFSFYGDFLMQVRGTGSNNLSVATRFGALGNITKWIAYDMSVTFPLLDGYIPYYFSTGYSTATRTQLDDKVLSSGSLFLDSRIGTMLFDGQLVIAVGGSGTYTYGDTWSDYGAAAYITLDKTLLKVVDLNFSYRKSYPANQAGNVAEPYWPGLLTIRNVTLGFDVNFDIKIFSFTAGIDTSFDGNGKGDGSKFRASAKVSLF